MIEEIVIIRKGGDARKFDAPEIFSTYFSKKDEIAKRERSKTSCNQRKQTLQDLINKKRMLQPLNLAYNTL